jgi:hypothetical protein
MKNGYGTSVFLFHSILFINGSYLNYPHFMHISSRYLFRMKRNLGREEYTKCRNQNKRRGGDWDSGI